MERSELEVVIEQLDEMLGSGVVDADDALEVAALAGLAARLGADDSSLAEATAWRHGFGQPMLEDAWMLLEIDEFVGAIDDCTGGDMTPEQVEEVVFDFDEIIAAAVWCGESERVASAASKVERLIRLVPDVFADLAPYGAAMSQLPEVAQNLAVYGYWLALCDAGEYADPG